MNFIPNTAEQRRDMLKDIGVSEIKDLFKDIPESIRLKTPLKLPKGMSELELRRAMSELADKNKQLVSFQGAGAYSHFIPAVVNHIISRSEFYTAYTPYQPELSQGILQAIFEYQTMICRLTGMAVANASMYDGASALAETAIICKTRTKRNELIISKTIHPEYRETVRTYANANSMKVVEVDFEEGKTDMKKLKSLINENTAGVMIQSPNFFGMVEDVKAIGNIAHEKNSVFVVCVNEATSLALLNPPGDLGADIVVGEGQSFGNAVNFGGPYLGIMAVKSDFVRQIPGRLVGETTDTEGRKGYLLTLQAREQHIRREKATSNICSNEALCALAAGVYLAATGKKLRDIAKLNYYNSHYLYNELKKHEKILFGNDFFNEFVVKINGLDECFEKAVKSGIIPGVKLERFYPELKDCLLVCATETATKKQLDKLLEVLG
ncbi:aminomethyl-transferring glycine dehydrogenase subunit GcvPA [Candidatus Woesearchaeota archaeon]|nr:aminomethyl-transferring glycine dehydrogenase subunit GcvPA [Candidatus Woesearchaeota archaeon]